MKRVLVVDDSPLVRAAVIRKIRAAGRDIIEADSLRAAHTVDAMAVACALLDLDLGDGWGTDVADALRAARADVPIAFFTSEQGGDRVERARTFGPIFSKPDGIDDAIAWIIRRS